MEHVPGDFFPSNGRDGKNFYTPNGAAKLVGIASLATMIVCVRYFKKVSV
jgi:hypothetical protein